MDLVERALAGERLALARLLTQIENDTPAGRDALDRLFPRTGRAHLIGITGAPGTGKSSLANRLARAFRTRDGDLPAPKVAVIAVDPSSPFTGGALLGDRLRMKDVSGDPGVFIRSMASRGTVGGLARATASVARALDAAGYDLILIETVGAGQSEVDIVRLAHTVIVVDAPGLGDDIQAIKAGILEIADILVVNKADLPGVENTLRALQSMLDIAYANAPEGQWRPPLYRAIASTGVGIDEIVQAIVRHAEALRAGGGWQVREQARLRTEFEGLLRDLLFEQFISRAGADRLHDALDRLQNREISPFQAARQVLSQAGKSVR